MRWFLLLVAGVLGGMATLTSAEEVRYLPIGDGSVIQDQDTNLQWMRCSAGQEWTVNRCVGIPSRFTWEQAVALTSTLAGHTDWRLPTVDELQTLVEYRMFDPAIDPVAFPGTPPANFWSASEAAYDVFYAWSVHFANGFSNWRHKRQRFEVRLVRIPD